MALCYPAGMRKLVVLAAMVLAGASLLSACGSSDEGEPADLAGKTFSTQTAVIDGVETPAAEAGSINLTFDEGSITINAGCNTLFGEATWTDGTIMVPAGTLASTMMACSEPLMAQDQLLASFFASNPTWTLVGETLTVTSETTSGISQIVLEQTS